MRCQFSTSCYLESDVKMISFVFILKGFISIKPFSPSFEPLDQVTHSSETLCNLISLCFFTSYSPLNKF